MSDKDKRLVSTVLLGTIIIATVSAWAGPDLAVWLFAGPQSTDMQIFMLKVAGGAMVTLLLTIIAVIAYIIYKRKKRAEPEANNK